jgi:protein-L-isoaspartate(D-aspartate) O-methyltransferase
MTASDARLDTARRLFAEHVACQSGALRERLEAALLKVPREAGLGPPPWSVATFHRNEPVHLTPFSDPLHLYQNVLVALVAAKGINNGEPGLHGQLLGALNPDLGASVLHIGCGGGYYTAVLAELVGPSGKVIGYEIEPVLAARAVEALKPWRSVRIEPVSGTAAELPPADAIYVNAGATRPHDHWLDALKDGGRLVFPLISAGESGWGVSMFIERQGDHFAAKVIGRAGFIACTGANEAGEGERVVAAVQSGALFRSRRLVRNSAPDDTAVLVGDGWWLSSQAKMD